jgi:hypothetical protein
VTSRTAFLLGALFGVETGVVVVVCKALRVSSAMTQELANDKANHRCPKPLEPLMDQYEMPEMLSLTLKPTLDPALGRSPITLGGRSA